MSEKESRLWIEETDLDLPTHIREGRCVYQDPARAIYWYKGTAWMSGPDTPDGVPLRHMPTWEIIELVEWMARELAEAKMIVTVPPAPQR